MILKKLFFIILYCLISFTKASTINNINNSEIISIIKSQITNIKNYSLDSIANKLRLKKDEKTIKTILHSFGYFDAEVKGILKNNIPSFKIVLNERYKFNQISLVYIDNKKYKSGLKIKDVFDLINIKHDSYTDTKQIANGCNKIKEFFEGQGFAFVELKDLNLKINTKTKKIQAIYNIKLNKKTVINKTIINIKCNKDPKLLEPFVKNRIPWKKGSIYNIKEINSLKEDLVNSGIFSSIEITLKNQKNDEKKLDIVHTDVIIDIKEALLRDVSAGVKFGSSEKLGLLFSWSNYNIYGKGSKLSSIFDFSKKMKTARLKYDSYDIFYKKQNLSNQMFYTKENVSSYNVSKIGAESILWQSFGKYFKAGIGGCFENSKTIDKITNEKNIDNKIKKFKAFGTPIGIILDTTDSFLDPQNGFRLSAMATPYFGSSANMSIISGKTSFYLPFQKNSFKNQIVIAIYSKIGCIIKNKDKEIPRDKLFFCGGANSIRGYGYQKIGKISNDNKPLGGKSLFEIGIEPRLRITDNIGVAAFIEGGNVYKSKVPKFSKKLFWGYGLGIRYYTPLGPIRLDVAIPTKYRKDEKGKKIDSVFNFYISIGQAF